MAGKERCKPITGIVPWAESSLISKRSGYRLPSSCNCKPGWTWRASTSIKPRRRAPTKPGFYNLDLQAQALGPQIFATQTHNTLRGSQRAGRSVSRVGGGGGHRHRYGRRPKHPLSATVSRFSLPSMALTPQLSVRQIPASEFTLFSATTTSLQMAPAAMPIIGRIHAEGDLVISGGSLASIYPVTAGGNISLANVDRLFAQSGPDEPASAFPVQSTTDNNWLAMARSVEHSTILSGRDLPMNTFEATDVTQMTTPALNTPPTTPAAQQQLWRQCNRIVTENLGKITSTTASGAECSPQEKRAFFAYYSRHNPGGVDIVFDLSQGASAKRPKQLLLCLLLAQPRGIVNQRGQSTWRFGDRHSASGRCRRGIECPGEPESGLHYGPKRFWGADWLVKLSVPHTTEHLFTEIISYMFHENSAGERSSQEANPDRTAIRQGDPWTPRRVHALMRREPDRVRVGEI